VWNIVLLGKEAKNGEGTRGMSSLKGKNGVKAVLWAGTLGGGSLTCWACRENRCQRTRGVSARTGDGPPHGIAAFKNSSGLVRKKEVVTEHIPV